MTMHPFRKVVVGLGRTTADEGLLKFARNFTTSDGHVEFRFVHVLRDRSVAISTAAAEIRASVAEHFGPLTGGDDMRCITHGGVRVDELIRIAANEAADLLLIGHHKERTGRRSLARRLAMQAPCSLLMAPEGSPHRISRVLCAVDFSDRSAEALEAAVQLCAHLGIPECHVLHVYFDEAAIMHDDYAATLRGKEDQAMSRFIERFGEHGVRLNPLFEESAIVSHAVERVAEREACDLVVMGTRGRSRAAAILLGGESEQALRDVKIPILIVKPRGEREGILRSLLHGDFLRPSAQFG